MTSVINVALAYNVLKLILHENLYIVQGDPLFEIFSNPALPVPRIMLKGKKSPALRNLTFGVKSPQMGPELTVFSSFIDFIHISFSSFSKVSLPPISYISFKAHRAFKSIFV